MGRVWRGGDSGGGYPAAGRSWTGRWPAVAGPGGQTRAWRDGRDGAGHRRAGPDWAGPGGTGGGRGGAQARCMGGEGRDVYIAGTYRTVLCRFGATFGVIHRSPSLEFPFCGVTREPHRKELYSRYQTYHAYIRIYMIDGYKTFLIIIILYIIKFYMTIITS
jgi:hypothetical protein